MDPTTNTQGQQHAQQNATTGTNTGAGLADKTEYRDILARENLSPQVKFAIRSAVAAAYVAGANADGGSPTQYIASLDFLR